MYVLLNWTCESTLMWTENVQKSGKKHEKNEKVGKKREEGHIYVFVICMPTSFFPYVLCLLALIIEPLNSHHISTVSFLFFFLYFCLMKPFNSLRVIEKQLYTLAHTYFLHFDLVT